MGQEEQVEEEEESSVTFKKRTQKVTPCDTLSNIQYNNNGSKVVVLLYITQRVI